MIAMIIGRFQVPNKTLKQMVLRAKKEGAEKVIIIIGSANEMGTERNPLSVMLRQHMISEIFMNEENVLITAINDENSDDLWKKKVLELVEKITKKQPDLYITGDKKPIAFNSVKTIKIKRERFDDDDIWKSILKNENKEKYLNKELIDSLFLHTSAIYLYKIKVVGTKEEIYDFDFRFRNGN